MAPIRVPHTTTTTSSSNKHQHRHRYNNDANHNTHYNNNQLQQQEKHNLVAIPPAGSNDNPLLSKNEYYETGEYYAPLCIHHDTLRIDIRKLKLCNSGACFDEQIGVSYIIYKTIVKVAYAIICSPFLSLALLCIYIIIMQIKSLTI